MTTLKRRHFLLMGVGAAGALGVAWLAAPVRSRMVAGKAPPDAPGTHRLNGWVTIAADGAVTISMSKMEMGQGIHTGLAMLLAEELDIEWGRVKVAPAFDDPIYNNQALAGQMANAFDPRHEGSALRSAAEHVLRKLVRELPGLAVTGASTGIRDQWEPMREAGAAARIMLLQAAAERWKVPVAECTTAAGRVIHASGRTLPYGEIAEAAARIPLPASPRLKPVTQFKLIGKPVPRLDAVAKSTGAAQYGMDMLLDGMLYASPRMCPVLGGNVKHVDAARALSLGAIGVAEFGPRPGGLGALGTSSGGVAAIAPTPHQAIEAAQALDIAWDVGAAPLPSSRDALAELRRAVRSPDAKLLFERGPVEESLQRGRVVRAAYEVPFLAHAAMEPMNCTVRVGREQVDVWVGCQGPGAVQQAVAEALDRPRAQVRVHAQLMGGGFGRRTFTDCAVQAALVARTVPERPLQFFWTREQDTAHDFYRAAFVAECAASLDDAGRVTALDVRLAGTSLGQPALLDPAREGTVTTPYELPALRVRHAIVESGIPTGIWRSVAHSYNVFFMESFIDELAAAAASDPLALRRRLLAGRTRHLHVLDTAARLAAWHRPLAPAPDGQPQARGIALCECFGSVVAQVARVSIGADRTLRVHEVTCVIDCGLAVNPNLVRQQMEGGIVYGLSAALHGRIDIEDGQVRQSNFHDQPVLRMDECPAITTHVVPSADPPTGVGEASTPAIAPAVANAVFALTGRRLRTLPFTFD